MAKPSARSARTRQTYPTFGVWLSGTTSDVALVVYDDGLTKPVSVSTSTT